MYFYGQGYKGGEVSHSKRCLRDSGTRPPPRRGRESADSQGRVNRRKNLSV